MRLRPSSIGTVGAINSDGHAVGVDIGATAIRAAVLALDTADGRPSISLHGIDSVPLRPGVVVNGTIMDPEYVTDALKQLWHANDFACKHVILGVASPQVLVRDLQMPNLTEQQKQKALPFQAREIIALPLDQVILDFTPLGEPDPDTNLVNGLLVAAPRQPVLVAVTAAERAGLKVARVDLASFAALRSTADDQLGVEAVIDLGAHLTTVVIHSGGVPRLVRTLARGGDVLTDRLAEKLSLTREVAEGTKCQLGLTQADAGSTALSEAIRPLLAEIRSSVNYFRTSNRGVRLERITLTGGASQLPGLDKILAEQNGVPTTVIMPMDHLRNRWIGPDTPADEHDRSASAVSIGLAMGAAA